MKNINNFNLINAAIIGENENAFFIVEGNLLHATDQVVANHRQKQSDPKVVLPVMIDALQALVDFATGKVESHFLDIDFNYLIEADEKVTIDKVIHIYRHLPHSARNELSSCVHCKSFV